MGPLFQFLKKHTVKIASVLLVIFIVWCGYIVIKVQESRENIGELGYVMYSLNQLSENVMQVGQLADNDTVNTEEETRQFLQEKKARIEFLISELSTNEMTDVSEEMNTLDSLLFSYSWDSITDEVLRLPDAQRIYLSSLEVIDHAKNKAGFSFFLIGSVMDPMWFRLYFIIAITCLLGIVMTILVKKQRDSIQQIEEARIKAESATRMKSEFLAVMSHEIRTPLNAVIGMSDLLLETRLDEEQKDYAETIIKGGDNLLSVINDVLDYSKLEAGHMELDEEPFNLPELIGDVLDLMAIKAGEKEIELLYFIEEGVPTDIISDKGRLRQVLLNLVGNAIKFTDDGEVALFVDVSDEPESSQLIFSVRDTGIGIPTEKLNKLFKSFSQMDSSTTRKYGGTGLGLVISKKIVNLMGGDIWVKSESEVGSTFYFTIKLDPADIQSSTQENLGVNLDRRRVLLVDDNSTNLKILEKQCAKWKMKTVSFQDPAMALSHLEKGNRFDLAIVDMQMHGLDGVQFIRKSKNTDAGHALPAILLTSLGITNIPEAGQEFDRVLQKPVGEKSLKKAVADVLENTRSIEKRDHVPTLPEHQNGTSANEGVRILIAEDDPINQKVASKIFKKLGYEVDLASDGKKVLAVTHRKDYHIIFMDIQMPGMDGYETTKRIRERLNENTVIIAMTAHALEDVRERSIQAGMDDFMTKPVQLKSIQNILDKWLPKLDVVTE